MPKLTKKIVEAIQPKPHKHFIVWDSLIAGFGVRVMPSGRKTYLIRYRANSQDKKMKLGIHGSITADQARNMAKNLLGRIAHGEDPALEKKQNKVIPTMAHLAQEYLDKHAPTKKKISVESDIFFINTVIIPTFGTQKVTDITRHKIANLHALYKNKKTRGNRLLSLLSKMFNLAIDWGYCEVNPVSRIQRYKEKKRERWLKEEEIGRLLKALEDYPSNSSANLVHFLLLTGSRKGEALCATWDQFDLNKGFWTLSSDTTKQDKAECQPLSQPVIDFLKKIKETSTSPYVFPGKNEGEHLKEPKRFWKSLKQKIGLEDVTLHDLRHTYASHLASQGVSLVIIGKLLGHSQVATTQRYAHLAYKSLKDATNLFGNVYQEAQKKQ